MEKKKRKICFAITIIGILIIVVTQIIISIIDVKEEKKENYIKENVISASKKCFREEKCSGDIVFFSDLIDKGYLNGYFLEEIKDYSKTSYINIPSYEVNLIKK